MRRLAPLRWWPAVLVVLTTRPAQASEPRVEVLREGRDPGGQALVDELRIHLERSHPKATFRARIASPQGEELGLLAQNPPAVLVTVGLALARQALALPWARARLVPVGLPEHSPEARDPRLAPVVERCPPDTLLRLVRKMSPGARELRWVSEPESAAGPLAATLSAAAPASGFSLTPSGSDLAWEGVQGVLLPVPLVAPGAQGKLLGEARARKVPVFGCDRGSVAEGATAGLVTDPQQMGEAAGRAVAAKLEGKEPRGEAVEMGNIAVHRGAACEAGAVVSDGVLRHGVIFEKEASCAPPARAPTPGQGRWWALALGGLGSVVGAAAVLRLRGRA
ncbi:MAG: ABC transporter substrate-binding protein [Polyangiaceae bacterium]|nr:ABC transporter substrate-binding protein [Polyangiaceae bacterium]